MTRRSRLLAATVAALLVACGVWLWWDATARRSADRAGAPAMQAARDAVVAMLSYRPETVAADLDAARDRMTGELLDDYTQLIKTVVIPDALNRRITATAAVPASAVVSAEKDRVVVLAYIDQTTTAGTEKPTTTTSTARVRMEQVDGRWLVAAFEPI